MTNSQENRILAAFLNDAKRFKHLSDKEQRRLARICFRGERAKECLAAEACLTSKQRGSLRRQEAAGIAAAKRLTETNLRLAVAYAKGKERPGVDFLDIIQAAALATLIAATRYDPKQPSKFTSYAVFWHKPEYLKLLTDSAPLAAPRHFIHDVPDVYEAEHAFIEAHGREPSDKELAAEVDERKRRRIRKRENRDIATGMKPSVAGRLREFSRMTFQSLDAEAGYGSGGRFELPSADPTPESLMHRKCIIAAFRRAVREFERVIAADPRVSMRERHLDIFHSRIVAEKEDALTMEQIAKKHGVTREAIRQHEAPLRKKFKTFLAEAFPCLVE